MHTFRPHASTYWIWLIGTRIVREPMCISNALVMSPAISVQGQYAVVERLDLYGLQEKIIGVHLQAVQRIMGIGGDKNKPVAHVVAPQLPANIQAVLLLFRRMSRK